MRLALGVLLDGLDDGRQLLLRLRELRVRVLLRVRSADRELLLAQKEARRGVEQLARELVPQAVPAALRRGLVVDEPM